MIKFLSLIVIPILMFPVAVYAQEKAEDFLNDSQEESQTLEPQADIDDPLVENEVAVQEPKAEIKPLPADDDNYEERLKLSRNMHEIWPIRPKIENALEVISKQIEPTKRLEFKSGMRNALEYDALEEASVDVMADIFSVAELQAMIDFYGSKEGRSVSFKTTDYEQALIPIMTKMVDKALLDSKLGQ